MLKKTLQEQHSRRFRDICAAGFPAWLAFEGPEQDWTLDTKYWSLDTSRPVRVGRACWRSLYTNFREIHNFFEFFFFFLWWGQHLDRFRMHRQRFLEVNTNTPLQNCLRSTKPYNWIVKHHAMGNMQTFGESFGILLTKMVDVSPNSFFWRILLNVDTSFLVWIGAKVGIPSRKKPESCKSLQRL